MAGKWATRNGLQPHRRDRGGAGHHESELGFRYGLDYREVAYGIRTLEVLVSADGGPPVQLSKRDLVVVDRMQSPVTRIPYADTGVAPMSAHATCPAARRPARAAVGLLQPARTALAGVPQPGRAQLHHAVRHHRREVMLPEVEGVLHRSRRCFTAVGTATCWRRTLDADSDDYSQGTTLYGGAALGGAFLGLKQRAELGWVAP